MRDRGQIAFPCSQKQIDSEWTTINAETRPNQFASDLLLLTKLFVPLAKGQLPVLAPCLERTTYCRSVAPAICAAHFRVCRQCADFQSLTIIRHSQAEGCAVFAPLRPPPGGRRLAAARTDVSDRAGFAPNHEPKAVCHEPRFPSRPATLPPASVLPLPRSALFFPAAALVKKKTSRKRREREKQ